METRGAGENELVIPGKDRESLTIHTYKGWDRYQLDDTNTDIDANATSVTDTESADTVALSAEANSTAHVLDQASHISADVFDWSIPARNLSRPRLFTIVGRQSHSHYWTWY